MISFTFREIFWLILGVALVFAISGNAGFAGVFAVMFVFLILSTIKKISAIIGERRKYRNPYGY